MVLGKPFRCLFYVLYQWNERRASVQAHGRDSVLQVVAYVAVLLGLNVAVVLQLTVFFFHADDFATQLLSFNARLTAIILFLIMGLIVWVSFVASGSYKHFAREFDTASKEQIRRRKVLFASYIALTVCTPILVRLLTHRLCLSC